MTRTAEPHVDPGAPPSGAEALASAWAALRGHIAARSRELDDEVRRYPTPIARCDDQLPKLLEQRGHAFRQRRLADEADAAAAGMPSSVRASHLAQFLAASAGSTDDDVETALRQRLADAIAASFPPGSAANPLRRADDGKGGGRQPVTHAHTGLPETWLE